MTGGVTSFSTGLRVDLGSAQANLPDQVSRDAVTQLLARAKDHPGYQAHAERYELRLRELGGHAVLELKEKNWASRLKNVFSYSRRSEERLAASQAIGQLFRLSAPAPGARLDGATARALAAALPQSVSLQQDLAQTSLSLRPQTSAEWAQGLEASRSAAASQPVHTETGLYTGSELEHRDTTLSRRHTRGFTLFMGDFDRSMLPDPAAPASSRELTRYTEERKGSRGIKHAFNALSLAKRLSGEGLGAAKRNLMAVLGAPIRQQWLASASARFQDKYGARLSCSKEAGLATFVDIESNKASAWGPANEWADVKLRFQGQLQITPDGAESAAQPLPFHASVHIRVKWDELAQPDFRFESRHVRRFEENLGRLAKPALPKFPWAD